MNNYAEPLRYPVACVDDCAIDWIPSLKAAYAISLTMIVMSTQMRVTVSGIVKTVVASSPPTKPEITTISIAAADDAYREIQIEAVFKNKDGDEVSLKPGAEVLVTIGAERKAALARAKEKKGSDERL